MWRYSIFGLVFDIVHMFSMCEAQIHIVNIYFSLDSVPAFYWSVSLFFSSNKHVNTYSVCKPIDNIWIHIQCANILICGLVLDIVNLCSICEGQIHIFRQRYHILLMSLAFYLSINIEQVIHFNHRVMVFTSWSC